MGGERSKLRKLPAALSKKVGKLSLNNDRYAVLSADGFEYCGVAPSEYRVPAGTRLVLWQPAGYNMKNRLGILIENGEFPPYEPWQILNLGDRIPPIFLKTLDLPTGTAPNVTLLRVVGDKVPLWTQLRDGMGDVHLTACRKHELPPDAPSPLGLPPPKLSRLGVATDLDIKEFFGDIRIRAAGASTHTNADAIDRLAKTGEKPAQSSPVALPKTGPGPVPPGHSPVDSPGKTGTAPSAHTPGNAQTGGPLAAVAQGRFQQAKEAFAGRVGATPTERFQALSKAAPFTYRELADQWADSLHRRYNLASSGQLARLPEGAFIREMEDFGLPPRVQSAVLRRFAERLETERHSRYQAQGLEAAEDEFRERVMDLTSRAWQSADLKATWEPVKKSFPHWAVIEGYFEARSIPEPVRQTVRDWLIGIGDHPLSLPKLYGSPLPEPTRYLIMLMFDAGRGNYVPIEPF
ncbi:MAG: putative adhesin [Methylococcales bacterium]